MWNCLSLEPRHGCACNFFACDKSSFAWIRIVQKYLGKKPSKMAINQFAKYFNKGRLLLVCWCWSCRIITTRLERKTFSFEEKLEVEVSSMAWLIYCLNIRAKTSSIFFFFSPTIYSISERQTRKKETNIIILFPSNVFCRAKKKWKMKILLQ